MSAAMARATYSLGENQEQPNGHAMALVALSHTVAEHQIYSAMLDEISRVGTRVASFSSRQLMTLTGISGYSTVRRALSGLTNKLSIERQKVAGDNGRHQLPTVYLVFTPEEILARRRAMGLPVYSKEVESGNGVDSLGRAIRCTSRAVRGARPASRRACSMTSAADIAVGAFSASAQRPSFSMRIGTGS